MVKSHGRPQDPQSLRMVLEVPLLPDLILVDQDLTLVKAIQVGQEDPIQLMVAHHLNQDTHLDQEVPLVANQVARQEVPLIAAVPLVELPSILVLVDRLHMECRTVQVLMDLHLTEQWVDTLVLVDHPCPEVKEILLPDPQEHPHHQALLVQAPIVAQLQTSRNC